MKKNLVSTAVLAALGLGMSGTAYSAPLQISNIIIADVGSCDAGGAANTCGAFNAATDGNSGGFRFNVIDPVDYAPGVSKWTGDVGGGVMNWQGGANATGSFSTGFNFSGSPFVPFTYGGGAVGTIDDVTNAVSITSLDFGGNFQSTTPADFLLPPDVAPTVNWIVDTADTNQKLISMSWSHYITSTDDPSGYYVGFNANWIIEGTATLVPVPAAAWLFGSGVIGLAGVARRRRSKK